jgi:hypothetical protein
MQYPLLGIFIDNQPYGGMFWILDAKETVTFQIFGSSEARCY